MKKTTNNKCEKIKSDKKGITLVSLIIMIVVLLILISVSVYSGTATVRYMKYQKAKAETETMQTQVNNMYEQSKKNVKYDTVGTEITNELFENTYLKAFAAAGISKDDAIAYYKLFTPKDLEEKVGIGGIDFDYLVSIENRRVILADGIKYQNKTYYTPEDFGITNIDTVPIDAASFSLEFGTNPKNSSEAVILVKDLSIEDSMSNEVNISKFSIEYSNDGKNWNKYIETNKVKSNDKIEYVSGADTLEAYPLPIYTSGTYEVRIVDSSGNTIGNSQTINITNIPDYWEVTLPDNSEDWYAYMDSDNGIAEVNAPNLADGMLAIKYRGDKTSTYSAPQLTEGSRWANAITKDGSMWVWIPRYAYKITSGYHQSGTDINPSDGTKGAGTIEIAFLRDNTNEFLNPNITGTVVTSGVTDATYQDSTKWILAPGFDFGGEQLSGFWFAKFEASNTNGYGSSASTANNPNLTLQVKPNVTSWRNINTNNIFTVCLNLTSNAKYKMYFNDISNVDTHMTKNVEWGAVAYLAHSTYGTDGKEVYINNNRSGITGISGDTVSENGSFSTDNKYNTIKGINASTTINVYGIYDMNGCGAEYVSACLVGNENLLTTDLSKSTSKYIDLYNSYSIEKYGDAVYETSNSATERNAWFRDYSHFGNNSAVFARGSYASDSTAAGMFYYNLSSVTVDSARSFRPVCIVK